MSGGVIRWWNMWSNTMAMSIKAMSWEVVDVVFKSEGSASNFEFYV